MIKLTLSIAESKEDKQLCDKFVIANHGYVASAKTVGRCMKYMIYNHGEFVGTFWLGSGFKPTPKALLRHVGMSQSQFDQVFNEYADNKRFCIIPGVANLGSQILKQIRKTARCDWKNRYGNDLQGIVTTIGAGRTGAVYKADNWLQIGETSGLQTDRKSVSMKWADKETISQRFVKPTGENKKLIFYTDKI
jgi:hypothetical protein